MMRWAPALAAFFVAASVAARASTCDNLTALTIPNAKVTATEIITAGPNLLPGDRALGAERSLPEYCRVTAMARPANHSEINIEIWLPEADQWNDKFVGTNSVTSSAMDIAQMQSALRKGYAVAGFTLKNPPAHREKEREWARSAIHLTKETAALVIRSYYGHPATRCIGCENNGVTQHAAPVRH